MEELVDHHVPVDEVTWPMDEPGKVEGPCICGAKIKGFLHQDTGRPTFSEELQRHKSEEALKEMTREAEELGLYDDESDVDRDVP